MVDVRHGAAGLLSVRTRFRIKPRPPQFKKGLQVFMDLISRIIKYAFLLSYFTASWAFALEGRLIDDTGAPLSGARITLADRSGMIVADAEGQFVLNVELKVPFVLFVARADGVAMRPVTITHLPETGVLTIHVEPISETLTVVSGMIPDLEVPPAVATSVISRADLSQRQPLALADALENIPGTSRSAAGHGAVPGLRGLPKHRTLVLLDEGRVSAERRAGVSATFLDLDTIDEVEVVRGPGCVAYGSDAFGGVIRARSRMPAMDGPTRLHYSLSGGLGLDELGGSAEVTSRLFQGGILVGIQAREYDDYHSPDGLVEDTGARQRGYRLAYQKAVKGGTLRMGWRTDESLDVGKPTESGDLHHRVYPEESSARFHLGFDRPGPGAWQRLAFGLSWNTYAQDLDKRDLDENQVIREVARSEVDARDYEFRFEGERSLGAMRLVVGANGYGRYGLEAINRYLEFDAERQLVNQIDEWSVENARRDDIGIFAGLSRDFTALRVSAGARLDRVTSRNEGGYFGDATTNHTDWSGFLALRYQTPSTWAITGQVARGFRDALISDRYYRGETGRGFITGNPDLEPEDSLQFDVSIRGRVDDLDLAFFAYSYRIADLIERYKSDGDYFFRNRNRADILGLELEGEWRLSGRSALQFSASWQRGETDEDGAPTDDIAAPGGTVVWRMEPSTAWFWFVRLAAYAEDDRPGPNEQRLPGTAVFDAGAGLKINDAFTLQLSGRNLLDRTYLGSADADAFPAPGRSIHLRIKGRL